MALAIVFAVMGMVIGVMGYALYERPTVAIAPPQPESSATPSRQGSIAAEIAEGQKAQAIKAEAEARVAEAIAAAELQIKQAQALTANTPAVPVFISPTEAPVRDSTTGETLHERINRIEREIDYENASCVAAATGKTITEIQSSEITNLYAATFATCEAERLKKLRAKLDSGQK